MGSKSFRSKVVSIEGRFHLAKKLLTFHLSIDLENKISFSKRVCSERTLGNEKTSTCPETLVELKFRVGGQLIQTYIKQ